MARATAVKMPPEASAVHGCEGARRVLALMLAFSADKNTLTARDLAAATGIALPSVYRYITLLRETGLSRPARKPPIPDISPAEWSSPGRIPQGLLTPPPRDPLPLLFRSYDAHFW